MNSTMTRGFKTSHKYDGVKERMRPNDQQRKEYDSQFKKQVRELTITCVYDYNTVYRVCSVYGITKAKYILNNCFDEQVQYLLEQFWHCPSKMTYEEEDAVRAALKHVDSKLPELFESLLESSEYNIETLYHVFMSHGSEAKGIIEYATENELMPFQLLKYSEKKLSESADDAAKKMRKCDNSMSKEGRLPKKFKNGWYV